MLMENSWGSGGGMGCKRHFGRARKTKGIQLTENSMT